MLSVTPARPRPLIDAATSASVGSNLNGPSVIAVPAWVPEPLGRYYLYFAHHHGTHIRLAYADDLDGPWQVYAPGTLHLHQTGFTQRPARVVGADGAPAYDPPHIASPDAHVLDEPQCIALLYHGLHADGSQATRMAVSPDGLTFTEVTGDLGPAYLRSVRWRDGFAAVAWGGEVFSAPGLAGPYARHTWNLGDHLAPGCIPRHPILAAHDGAMAVVYTSIGDDPERIWCADVDAPLVGPWRVGQPALVLSPTQPWEGATDPVRPSRVGMAAAREHALRDPCVFHDRLFYVGGGEQAIGSVQLTWRCEPNPR